VPEPMTGKTIPKSPFWPYDL